MRTINFHVEEAIKATGSQRELAARAGLSQQHISKIRNLKLPVSAKVAVAIERATHGKISRAVLCPEIFAPVR